ncbi:hypothetical protein CCMA1212_005142 [Trichoderma ghanense]|uniref:Uncharacterized protein n=1 Tax=Trichoderma ghanense TaxID=65468 RepID=A0ABY2H580_9HYPO
MGVLANQVSAGIVGPTVTAAGAALGPTINSFDGVEFGNPSTPAISQMPMQMPTSMPMPMPSISSTSSVHQMQSMQSMAKNMPTKMGTTITSNMIMGVEPNPNIHTGTSVNQTPNMTLSTPPPPRPYRPVTDGHQNMAIGQPTTKEPQQHAPGSGIITQPYEKAAKTEAKALAPQHNSRVAKCPPVMSSKARALLRAMTPEAFAPTPVQALAPPQPHPAAAPEAMVVDEVPPPAPAPIPEAARAEPNLEDTPAARATPSKIDQERLDKLLVCKHWERHHMISFCQQVEIMAGNRGNDYTTWRQRLIKRRESRGLWNVYEIDGFLYEVDFNTGEARGVPRREYVKMVDKVKRKCCAPAVEEVVEENEEEVEEESEEDEGGGEEEEEKEAGKEDEGKKVDEDVEGKVGEAEEEEEEEEVEEKGEVEDKQEEEEGEMEGMEVVEEASQASAGNARSFLDLLDENGDVLPLEAWDQELRDGLAV